MNRNFKIGDMVQHFKRELNHETGMKHIYLILSFAEHTETGERMVVYKSVENGDVYVRPYDMFMSKTDTNKYPNAKQEFRFELF